MDDFTRLRLFRETDHTISQKDQWFNIYMHMEDESKTPATFEVHYVELQHSLRTSEAISNGNKNISMNNDLNCCG